MKATKSCVSVTKKIIAALMAVIMLSTCMVAVNAATPNSKVSTSGKLAYTLKGLKHNLVVQNYYIATNYIYATQRSGSTTYLSRLKINGKTATYMDEMTLLDFGHGQSLDMYKYNDKNYLYIGCKSESSSYKFSLQVARITYKAGQTYTYTDANRFTYMNYANTSGKSLGTTYRVAVGGNSTYTIFRIQTEEGSVTYSIYDTAAINKLLDKNKTVSMKSAEAKKACKRSFTQTGSGIVRPNSSFQGIDMVGNSHIYISGGPEGKTPQMARMTNTGTFAKLVTITNVGDHEIEGVQCKDNRVYFLIVPNPTSKTDTQQIYYVNESIFK